MFLYKAVHYLIGIGLFYITWIFFRYDGVIFDKTAGFRYNYLTAIGYAVFLAFFNHTYNSYLFGYCRIRTLAFAQFLSQLFSVCLIYLIVGIGWWRFKNPIPFLMLLAVYIVLDLCASYYGNWLYFRFNPPRKTLFVYRNQRDRRRFGTLTGKPIERLYRVVKEIEYDGSFRGIKKELDTGYEAVFVAGLNSHARNGILKYCEENSIRGFFLPHIGDVIMQGAEHIQAFDSPVMMVRRRTLSLEYRAVKRGFDLIASAAALILLSPVFAITAAAIKLYDRGPVFYRQVRLTTNGRPFKIIKFRSMRVDAEKDGIARLSTGNNDDRITPIGKIIRKIRIDELPQLWNILIGDMSIVGPRPERPEIAEQYRKSMSDFQLRLQVKAGLTGYAQVYGKYNTDPYEKLEFDLLYINNMSVLTDLELMFATVSILFLPESTEGVAVGATTAMDYENPADSTENDAETVAK